MLSHASPAPSWRMRVARAASARPALAAGLAAGARVVLGPILGPWLTFHGALVEDVDAALTGATSPRAWRTAWTRVADARAAHFTRARDAGARATAFAQGVSAAVGYHVAPYLTPEDAAERRRLLRTSAAVYADATACAPWRVTGVSIPWRGHALPGLLHAPAAVERPPVVVVVNAIAHYKEMWTGIARTLTERGVAVLAFDGPGEGELAGRVASPLHAEEIASPVLDHLESRGDVDASRAGLMGISLAGTLAARAAAMDPRWKAVAANAPAFDPTRYAKWLPPMLLASVAERVGLSVPEVLARVDELSLARVAHRLTQPLFVVQAGKDHLLPDGEGARLVDAARSEVKRLVHVHDSEHAGIADFHRVMHEAADFLADALGAGA